VIRIGCRKSLRMAALLRVGDAGAPFLHIIAATWVIHTHRDLRLIRNPRRGRNDDTDAMANSPTEPAELAASFGGVVRTARLIEAGISRKSLDHAVRAGTLLRIQRGWVAVPGADAMLTSAAKAGVVLTCLTQAERLGIWVHEHPVRHHVGAKPHGAPVTSARVHVHWAKPLVPRHPDALADPIENVLALVAD